MQRFLAPRGLPDCRTASHLSCNQSLHIHPSTLPSPLDGCRVLADTGKPPVNPSATRSKTVASPDATQPRTAPKSAPAANKPAKESGSTPTANGTSSKILCCRYLPACITYVFGIPCSRTVIFWVWFRFEAQDLLLNCSQLGRESFHEKVSAHVEHSYLQSVSPSYSYIGLYLTLSATCQ